MCPSAITKPRGGNRHQVIDCPEPPLPSSDEPSRMLDALAEPVVPPLELSPPLLPAVVSCPPPVKDCTVPTTAPAAVATPWVTVSIARCTPLLAAEAISPAFCAW